MIATPNNVICFQSRQRNNDISRSSRYGIRRTKLSNVQQIKLQIIESKFLQDHNYEDHSKIAIELRDVSTFICEEGELNYCNCESSNGYRLLDFELAVGDGGGYFSDYTFNSLSRPASFYDQITARVKSRITAVCLTTYRAITRIMLHNPRRRHVLAVLQNSNSLNRRSESVNDLMRFQSALFMPAKDETHALPVWSILHSGNKAKYLRLEGSYARRIAVGEFTCRLVEDHQLSMHQALHSSAQMQLIPFMNNSFLFNRADFFRETQNAIRCFSSPELMRETKFNYYKVPGIYNHEAYSYNTKLHLLKSEIACYLSEIISTKRLSLRDEKDETKKDSMHRSLYVQYSLLSKFIYLTDHCIEIKKDELEWCSGNRVEISWPTSIRDRDYINDLEKFSESTNLLSALIRTSYKTDLATDINDEDIQSKIVEVTSELLEAQNIH